MASFYETETGQFCCEICPDEEDVERRRTLKARKDLAKLMADDDGDDSEEDNNDSVSENPVPIDLKTEGDNSSTQPVEDVNNSTAQNVMNNNTSEEVEDSSKDANSIVSDHEESDQVETNVEPSTEEEILACDDSNEVVIDNKDDYPEDNNPFGEEEFEAGSEVNIVVSTDKEIENNSKDTGSSNPFGDDDSEEDEEASNDTVSNNNISSASNMNPFGEDFSSDEDVKQSVAPASPSVSVVSGQTRKKRQAPLPPSLSVTPVPSPRRTLQPDSVKSRKDADNISKKRELLSNSSQSEMTSRGNCAQSEVTSRDNFISCPSPSPRMRTPDLGRMRQDKAEEGKYKRKKGPAPSRPLPPKRAVKKLPRKAINQELFDIEVKQAGLEKQGVKLEKSIREICAVDDAKDSAAGRDSLGPEAEDLIIQLFDLVNEKNELFRRQTELVYMKKENRLEEVHADLEYQIRVLMNKPETQRTDEDR